MALNADPSAGTRPLPAGAAEPIIDRRNGSVRVAASIKLGELASRLEVDCAPALSGATVSDAMAAGSLPAAVAAAATLRGESGELWHLGDATVDAPGYDLAGIVRAGKAGFGEIVAVTLRIDALRQALAERSG